MVYSFLKNLWWHTQAHCCLNKQCTAFAHCPSSLFAVSFLFYISSALVYPTATAVLSFKPSAIKQQKIPYPISSWLQLSASVIPLLCTRLSELNSLSVNVLWVGNELLSSAYWLLSGEKHCLSVEKVSVVEPESENLNVSFLSGFDASLLYISVPLYLILHWSLSYFLLSLNE